MEIWTRSSMAGCGGAVQPSACPESGTRKKDKGAAPPRHDRSAQPAIVTERGYPQPQLVRTFKPLRLGTAALRGASVETRPRRPAKMAKSIFTSRGRSCKAGRAMFKNKKWFSLCLLSALLAGCADVTLTNLTPTQQPRNANGQYLVEMKLDSTQQTL